MTAATTLTTAAPARPRAGRLGHVPALDGIRALAITLVVVYHAVMPLHFGGAGGVDIFFVLSGFLITTLLLEEHDSNGRISLRRFYVRRAVRLYPPLLIMLVVVFVPISVLMGLGNALWGTVMALFYLMPVGAETGADSISAYAHTWTLGLEEWFYFVWPVALILLVKGARTVHGRRMRRALAAALIATFALAATALTIEAVTGHMSVILRACALLAGCALALVLRRSDARAQAWHGVAGLGLIAFSVVHSSLVPLTTVDTLAAAAGALLLIVAMTRGGEGGANGVIRRVLSLPPLTYVGRISYEIYLWHYPVLCLFGVLAGTQFLGVGGISAAASLLLAAIAFAVTKPLVKGLRAKLPV
ncbi:acyltransferase [Sinomonas sp. ASV486]|nr:acyltransferase [Sinomonas sp. ASV486]